MRCRFLVAGFVLLMMLTTALAVPATGQTRDGAPEGWTAPRTPWGDPDLQGQWNSQTSTPLERPLDGRLAETDNLSPEEAQAIEDANRAAFDLPPREGSVGNYNAFWRDVGTALTRTSLIVDPPDGRIPPLSAGGEARIAAERAERSQRGPATSPGHLQRPEPVDPLHLARLERHRELVQQQLPNLPGAGLRRRLPGADPRAADHPARRPPACRGIDPPVAGRFARTLGG